VVSIQDTLPENYYLDNFEYLIHFVASHYPDVLSEEELVYFKTFTQLPFNSRQIYVRLMLRKGPLFRDDRLSYTEISDQTGALALLADSAMLDNHPFAVPVELLNLLTRPELKDFCSSLPRISVNLQMKKEEVIAELAAQLTAEEIRYALPFTVLRPLGGELLTVYRLLFFGNLHQSFTDFVLRDLGISPFEDYQLTPDSRFFDDREVLEQALTIYEITERYHEGVADADPAELMAFASALPKIDPSKQMLMRRRDRIRNQIGRQLERLEAGGLALKVYESSDSPPARERCARIYAGREEFDEAWVLVSDILKAPANEAELQFAERFSRRLKRHLPPGTVITRVEDKPVSVSVTLAPDDSVSVEELARHYLELLGQEAFYVENGLLPSLFGLCFWDIIFQPIDGVFFNPFHRGPLDLFSQDFYQSRKDLIEQRMDQIQDSHFLQQLVLDNYENKTGIANHFVRWGWLSTTLLERSLQEIPVQHLISIFRRILLDLKANCSGFPDLITFLPEGGYCLVEVKGPGDRLQDNQKRWFKLFSEKEIPAEVMIVSWVEHR